MGEISGLWIVEREELRAYVDNNLNNVVDGVTSSKLRKYMDDAVEIVNRIALNSVLGKPDAESVRFLQLYLDNLFYAFAKMERFSLQYSFKRVVTGAVGQVLSQVVKNVATSLIFYQKL